MLADAVHDDLYISGVCNDIDRDCRRIRIAIPHMIVLLLLDFSDVGQLDRRLAGRSGLILA